MGSVHEYKRLENTLVQKIKDLSFFAAGGIISGCKTLGKVITRRYTIVLVPHSEKRVYNLHISVLSVCCAVLVFVGLISALFWYGASYGNTRGAFMDRDNRLKDAQASLDQLQDETSRLLRAARGFEAALSGTLSVLGAEIPKDASGSSSGDLSSFFDVKETAEGSLQEVEDIRKLAGYLSSAAEPIKELGALLDSQSALLSEIPSIWPIKGGIGHISMFFGQNENPFTGQYYIHKGIDISTFRQGDPLVATADGQIVAVNYDGGGFGNNIIIKHKHGFYTRYGHMQSFRVKLGQKVEQGEVIGYIGNTGLSTGPHVHYEVHIGSDVVDPYKYLNIRSSLVRR
ncbi:MAG: M23 family metallopeptidase [Treponema sp.]|nr:M23 family metallopeptidase [Treponema sp.]